MHHLHNLLDVAWSFYLLQGQESWGALTVYDLLTVLEGLAALLSVFPSPFSGDTLLCLIQEGVLCYYV